MNKDPVNEVISKAVAVFRSSPNLGDDGIYKALVADGIEQQLAARIVEFLPMAYCRILLVNKGVKFPDTFRRLLRDGSTSADHLLSSEPLWKAAMAFAQSEGASRKDILAVAARSAEFHAANQLLNTGSKLEDLTFMPVILTWPEDGPTLA